MSEGSATSVARLKPQNNRVILVETEDQLVEAIRLLSDASGPFALDAERASGFKYSQRAYLVQVTRQGAPIFLIDPISAMKAQSQTTKDFAELLGTDEWILHAATQDLPCLKELGLRPTTLFDTELAGRLLGEERVGLSALCEQWLGITLAKEHSAVDWSVRPLHDSWLNYAALDVDVLVELRLEANRRLFENQKAVWAKEEFERLTDFEPKPPKPDKWRGMSGLHDLKDQRSLAIAHSIWQAREALAIKMDVSPGRLVPDSSIVAVAKEQPKSKSALAGQKTFIGRASRTYLDTWWGAFQSGLTTLDLPPLKVPHTGIPNHRNWEAKFPEAHQRLQAARPTVVEIAEANNLPVENLLQPDALRQLCWQPPEALTISNISDELRKLGARNWQIKLVAEAIATALASALREQN
jgi:ribonuclease D